MARKVEADDLVVAGKIVGHRAPAPTILGEPVDEDEPGADTVHLGVELERRALGRRAVHRRILSRWPACPFARR